MKKQGFPELLALYVESRRHLPYAWGTNDCVTFAADAILEITGEDPLGDLRGTWTNEEEAMAVLAVAGGLRAAADARFRRVDKNFAQRGDLCLVKDGAGNPSLAIAVGGGHCAAPGSEELLLVSMNEVRLAWAV